MPKKKEIEVTGSLLQDVTLPQPGELEEGGIELFTGGEQLPQATDPQEEAVKNFLSGK